MSTCDQCKFWKAHSKAPGKPGQCSSPKWIRGYGFDEDEFEADIVWVEDDEGWAFFAGPKFGCVHFSPSHE